MAAILAVILGDYLDFGLILGLLILNSTLGYYEERGAQNAIQALKEQLAPEANVLRDGQWKVIQAAELVPGDVVKINMGDIVSADGATSAPISVYSHLNTPYCACFAHSSLTQRTCTTR